MYRAQFNVHCTKIEGIIPRLSHAVMGNMAYNLLPTGVKLQKILEEISDTPLLRRTMGTLNSGIGIDKSTGVYRERPDGTPIYDFTLMDQIIDVIVNPKSIPFFGISFMPRDLSSAPKEKLSEPGNRINHQSFRLKTTRNGTIWCTRWSFMLRIATVRKLSHNGTGLSGMSRIYPSSIMVHMKSS